MQVSFIIPLHNGLSHTRECLRTLAATLPAGLEHEVILVDDASTDGTRKWLAGSGAKFRVILNDRNLGFAATCNRGAEVAMGRILFFLNNDLELAPGWFGPMYSALSSGGTIGVVGNLQVRCDNGALDHAGIHVSSAGKMAHVQSAPRRRLGVAALVTVPGVTAACMAVSREIFLGSGKFDEAFLNGGEDIDFCFRIARRGLRSVVAIDSRVRHHVSAARGPTSERDERNSRLLVERWHDELVYWGSVTHAWEMIAGFLRKPLDRVGWRGLSGVPFALGWTKRPPAISREWIASALYREQTRWRRMFDLPPDARRAPRSTGDYREDRFYRDEIDPGSAWLRDRASLTLPAGFPASNIFLSGFLISSRHKISIGFRVVVNGRQVVEFRDIPADNFNFAIDDPHVLPDRPTVVEIELIGVDWSNFMTWAARMTRGLPLPSDWRRYLENRRRKARNRRLRFVRIVCDDEVIFDFKRDPALHALLRPRIEAGGINVIGWLRAAVGIGESARCMARASDATGLPAALMEMKLHCLNPHGDDTMTSRLRETPVHSVNVFHIDPPVSGDIDHHHGRDLRRDRYNIAYWAWELPVFPDNWVRQCAYFDEVWCPSEFVKSAIAAKCDLPVQVMPHAVEFDRPAEDWRPRFKLPAGRFLFLFIYDLNSYQERKNPLAVIDAYKKAFPTEDGVGLVIKTQNPARNENAHASLTTALAGLRHTHLILETLEREDVYRLESACDAFVSLHRSEGFGLAVAECMYLGKPVISTDWSATAEFIDATNGCPVRYTLTQLRESHGPYEAGQTWAEPDVAHAAEWMQQLIADPGLVSRIGRAARETIESRFSPAVVGARYRSRLEELFPASVGQGPA